MSKAHTHTNTKSANKNTGDSQSNISKMVESVVPNAHPSIEIGKNKQKLSKPTLS